MSWHWESYVHKNNLWYHFQRFSEVIRGINPIDENFIPSKEENDVLRIYSLKGKNTNLIWLRDKSNNWESELEQRIAPQKIQGVQLDLTALGITTTSEQIESYDPWKNEWTTIEKTGAAFTLPDFKRSLVVRVSAR